MEAMFRPGGRGTVVRVIDKPSRGSGEALLTTRAAGLCGGHIRLQCQPAAFVDRAAE